MSQHEQTAADPGRADFAPIAGQLRRVRSRAVGLLVLTGGATLLTGLVAVALAAGMLDFLLRTPAWLRLILWVAGIGALVVAGRRLLLPAWRFRPSLTEVALRLEKSDEGKKAGLAGVLASGLELSQSQGGTSTTQWMSGRVVHEAAQRFRGVKAASVLSKTRARHSMLSLAACAAGAMAVLLIAGPRLTGIGASRIFAPWAGAQWPKRTAVVDITTTKVHPIGTALPLRAAITRTDRETGKTPVAAAFRIVDGGTGNLSIRRVPLTGQRQNVAIEDPAAGEPASGELYEKLIEPGALAAAGATSVELEYWFETGDDRTEPRRIRLVEPPAVVSASASVTPPAYATAASVGGVKAVFVSGAIELGAGGDARAVVGPVLAGSEVELTIRLNKPVPAPSTPEDTRTTMERDAWIAAAFPGAGIGPETRGSFDGSTWTLRWSADRSIRLPVRPTDEYGLKPSEEAAYAFDIAEDRPPSATVIEPREDESVLATAVVDLAGEARDDVGISTISLTRQLAQPAKGSMGAAAEPAAEPETIVSQQGEAGAAGPAQASVVARLDLAPLGLKPGDEVWVRAVAADTYSMNGQRHDPVLSSPRKLRIISEEQLIDQVRSELAAVRKVAIRIEGEQAEIRKSAQGGEVSAEDRRRQSGITQRITQQNEAIQRLAERVERNRLDDRALEGTLADVSSILQSAAAESERASSKMDAAAKDQPEQERTPLSPEDTEEVVKAQDEVRDQLSRLAEMLDRGEDSWAVSRALQRLLEQQRDLQGRTQRAGQQNMGKRSEDLTAQERAELAEIAEQQQRLSETARQTIDQLTERAQQLEKADAAQSEAMKQAAERGRQQQVPQKMEEAAQSAQENQTSSANEQQQDAIEALEEMVQDMNDAQRKRDQHLRQVLANLIQSLDMLIREQETQLAALAAAIDAEKFDGLDAPMIALNQNTLDVADKARGDRTMARIAELVDRAAKAQESAISQLRAAPVNAAEAQKQELESLRLLKLARAEAQKQEEEARDRDADRKRRELRKIYRETLELQVALKGETDPFIGKTVDRRDRMKVRGLGERQETLRASLEQVRKDTQEMEEASVFDYAHTRLDQATGTSAKKLRAGQADRAVARNQASAVSILTALIQALDDQINQDDEFRDADSGGGGGGGQGGQQQPPPLIPPLAELRLLRAMQQEAADVTRSINEEAGVADELASLGTLQRGLADRGQELISRLQQPEPEQQPEIPGKPEGQP